MRAWIWGVVIITILPLVLGDLTCSFQTTCLNTPILYVQNETGGGNNSHAQLTNYSSYAYNICCSSSETISTNCSQGVEFLALSDPTNAHVQDPNNDSLPVLYPYDACIAGPGYETCTIQSTSCSAGYTCIASIASSEGNNYTNAHISSCGVYDLQVCCSVNSIPALTSANLSSVDDPVNSSRSTQYVITGSSADSDSETVSFVYDWQNTSSTILLLNLPFDKKADDKHTVFYDLSRNLTATLVPSGGVYPVWTPDGIVGGAFNFSGQGEHISVGNTTDFANLTEFTVLFWMRPHQRYNWQSVIGNQNYTGNKQGLLIYLAHFTHLISNELRFVVGSQGYGTGVLVDDVWTHVALVFNGTHMTSYQNGKFLVSVEFGNYNYTPDLPILIGWFPDPGFDTFTGFNGTIDEVYIFNRSLPAQAIKKLYDLGLAGKSLQNLTEVFYPGETIQSKVYPTDNKDYGLPVLTNNLTIRGVVFSENTTLEGLNEQTHIYVHVRAIGYAQNNITINLYNSTGLVSSQTSSSASFGYNFTGLDGGYYYVNATSYDISGNYYYTTTKNIVLNRRPITTKPTINTSTGLFVDGSNLSGYAGSVSDADGDATQFVFDWRQDGTSIMVLNVPFGVNDTIPWIFHPKSYSSYNDTLYLLCGNAIQYKCPVWTPNGKHGGAVYFDGVDDVIYFYHAGLIKRTYLFTLSFWINTNQSDGYIFGQRLQSETSGDGLRIYLQSGQVCFTGIGTTGCSTVLVNDSRWHQIMVRRNSSNRATLFVDGQQEHDGPANYNDGKAEAMFGNLFLESGTYYRGYLDEIKLVSWDDDNDVIYQRFLLENATVYNQTFLSGERVQSGENISLHVWALDGKQESEENLTWVLITPNAPPDTPTLLLPTNGNTSVDTRNPYFEWTAETDPDGGSVYYQINISADQTCAVIPVRNVSTNNYTSIEDLCIGKNYNWTVRACDDQGQCSAWASEFNFTIISTIGVQLLVNNTDFGTLDPSTVNNLTVNDTLDDNPPGMILKSTGTVNVNVDLRGLTALWVMQPLNTSYFMFAANVSNTTGDVLSQQRISEGAGGFGGDLDLSDEFGKAVDSVDIDNDGIKDLVVGAPGDDDGGVDKGAVWILFMNSNGTVSSEQKISDTAGNFTGLIYGQFGRSLTSVGDLDGDGVTDLVVGEYGNSSVSDRAVWVLFLNANGTVKNYVEINDTNANFSSTLNVGDRFGVSVDNIGDLNNDGIQDIAVGAYLDDTGGSDNGAVWVLFLNANGTVQKEQKIAQSTGNFSQTLSSDHFGSSVAGLGDLDGDGIEDLVVGEEQDDTAGNNAGAVYVLFLNTNGTVKKDLKITEGVNGFNGGLDADDNFGSYVSNLGDLDGDGVTDIGVGAVGDDDFASDAGALWILYMNSNGTVKKYDKISGLNGSFDTANLNASDVLGSSVVSWIDRNQDGVLDIVVGAAADEITQLDSGLLYLVDLYPAINWINVSTNYLNFTENLSYDGGKQIEFKITVPINEPPGVKSSNIQVLAEAAS